MRRFIALLIEEFLFIILFLSIFICIQDMESSSELIRDIIAINGLLIVVGKLIEVTIDYAIIKNAAERGIAKLIIRHVLCFILISIAYYCIFFFRFSLKTNSGTVVFILILSMCYSFMHLFISRTIDRVLNPRRIVRKNSLD